MALPRNRPVPIAPPRAIMESCLGVRFRCSPASRSRIALSAVSFVEAMLAARESAMAGHRIRKRAPHNSSAPERLDSISRSTTGLRRPFAREQLFYNHRRGGKPRHDPPEEVMKAVLALIIIYVGTFFVAIHGASQSEVQASPQASATPHEQSGPHPAKPIDLVKDADIRSLLELVGARDQMQDGLNNA